MTKIFYNFLVGIGNGLVISPNRDYIRSSGGFSKDVQLLRRDSRRVVSDLSREVKKADDGKQTYIR